MKTTISEERISFSYETMGNSSYLVASFKDGFAPINYQMEMISNNEIANILPANKHQKNAEVQIYYNVTSKISLSQAISRQKMSKDNFLNIVLGAVSAFKEVGEYQLVNTGIVLESDMIFVKTGSFEPAFVYLPVHTVDESVKRIKDFVVSLILKDVIAESNDNFVQKLLSAVNSDALSITELEKVVLDLKNASPIGENKNREEKVQEQIYTPNIQPPQILHVSPYTNMPPKKEQKFETS